MYWLDSLYEFIKILTIIIAVGFGSIATVWAVSTTFSSHKRTGMLKKSKARDSA